MKQRTRISIPLNSAPNEKQIAENQNKVCYIENDVIAVAYIHTDLSTPELYYHTCIPLPQHTCIWHAGNKSIYRHVRCAKRFIHASMHSIRTKTRATIPQKYTVLEAEKTHFIISATYRQIDILTSKQLMQSIY
jgi:hypothetical protein